MPTVEENYEHWNEEYDWSQLGEEWTPDQKWKRAALQFCMDPYLKPGMEALEIGPGGGRWTAELLQRAPARLICVDLSDKCVALCKQRFAEATNVEFHVNDGRSLSFQPDASIDFLWSFDVFVHMEVDTIEAYFAEIARVLRPGAVGVVHYPSIDRAQSEDPRQGWRGNVTSEEVLGIVEAKGLELVHDFFEPWISGTNTSVAIFRRPGSKI